MKNFNRFKLQISRLLMPVYSIGIWFAAAAAFAGTSKPNVILIMTDDQGYGDLACHGNPVVKTPNLDSLYTESVRLTDFHVSPFCTPSRAALMTGRYPARTGAFRTSSGRTMMHTDEQTIAEIFSANGYNTALIGKWHLGDNAPHRPQDRGFDHVIWHRCGGIGQASDFWGNDYFDDTYEVNGVFQPFEGYCTDVWFREAIGFVESSSDKPFFLYLAPNAPHGPYRVAQEWSNGYRESIDWRNGPEFYGMVENIDFNIGKLRSFLERQGVSENTILIFMTDNGTANGAKFDGLTSEALKGFNAGMRGKKSSVYEGGHRVPFFIHWPGGKITGGKDVDSLAAHLDVLPTLVELCEFSLPDNLSVDGISFAKSLREPKAQPERDPFVVQFQGGPYFSDAPQPWEYSCVLSGKWRLIDGEQLYHVESDPAQRINLAAKHPEVIERLRSHYLQWWDSVSPRMTPVCIDLGNPAENPVRLSSQDWYMESGNPPWHFGEINKLPRRTGPWKVHVREPGRYRITLRQWPAEAGKQVVGERARVEIAGKSAEQQIGENVSKVEFELQLPEGKTELHTYLYDEKGRAGGAYFTDVEKL